MINPYKTVDWNPSPGKIRRTLALIAVFFLIIDLILILKQVPAEVILKYSPVFFIVLLLGIFLIPFGIWIYRIWFWITCAVGFCISNLILLICFYMVITPLALIRRAFGSCPLPLKRKRESNWSNHEQKTDPGSYFRQF